MKNSTVIIPPIGGTIPIVPPIGGIIPIVPGFRYPEQPKLYCLLFTKYYPPAYIRMMFLSSAVPPGCTALEPSERAFFVCPACLSGRSAVGNVGWMMGVTERASDRTLAQRLRVCGRIRKIKTRPYIKVFFKNKMIITNPFTIVIVSSPPVL